MEEYPIDKSWWKCVASTDDFCSTAGLGPKTANHFKHQIEACGAINETTVRIAVENNTRLLFSSDDPIPSKIHEDLDEFVRIWVLVRRQFDETFPSNYERQQAVRLVENILHLEAKTDALKFATASTAFETSERTTATGNYASDSVCATLLHQHSEYSSSVIKYLSPYTTIVGPSGIGKSFSVKQLAARHGIYVAYSNLASSASQGYPRPVAMGTVPIRMGLKEADIVTMWETFLRNQIKLATYSKAAGITPAGLFELLTSQKGRIPFLREELGGRFRKTSTDGALADVDYYVFQPIKVHLENLNLNVPPTLALANDKVPVVICFDEARSLLDEEKNIVFRRLRTAARNIAAEYIKEADHIPFFLVLLDTTSRITNFTPPTQYDPSAKTGERTLFHPIYNLDTFDIFSQSGINLSEPLGTKQAMIQLLSYGRPLWGAFLRAGYSWHHLVEFASGKMSAQKDPLAYGVSLLSYRINFYICSPILAETMVAASMRYLVSISKDRNSLMTTQPSEPVLALAASRLLSKSSTRLSSIRMWISALHSGLINPGDVGEQVASLILLFASDAVSGFASEFQNAARQPDGMPRIERFEISTPKAIPFADFMMALLGRDAWQTVPVSEHSPITKQILSSGMVFFNHFVRASSVPTRLVLECTYKRGAALFMPSNFAGMDVAIPIRMPGGGMAVLMIQIKNRRNDSFTPGLKLYMEEAMEKAEKALGLSLGRPGDLQGIVGLVMCLRTHQEPHFAAIMPKSVLPQHTTTTRKGKEKETATSDAKPASSQILGIAFGLSLKLYPSMKVPNGTTSTRRGETELQEAEEICQLLATLLASWPDAFSRDDVDSGYVQRLLDPFHNLYPLGQET